MQLLLQTHSISVVLHQTQMPLSRPQFDVVTGYVLVVQDLRERAADARESRDALGLFRVPVHVPF